MCMCVCVYVYHRFQSVNRCVGVGPALRDGDGQVSERASARRGFLINAASAPIRVDAVTGGTLAAACWPSSDELVTSIAAATPDDRSPPERNLGSLSITQI